MVFTVLFVRQVTKVEPLPTYSFDDPLFGVPQTLSAASVTSPPATPAGRTKPV
jgi:hypothetical protein